MRLSLKNLDQSGLRLLILIIASLLFGFSLIFGISAGIAYGRSQATLAYVQKIGQALAYYKADQGIYPSADQFYNQRILVPDYLSDFPQPQESNGACSNYKQFFYSQQNPLSYNLQFCLSQKTGGLAAGVHILTQKGLQ
jgi:hypothetical protein